MRGASDEAIAARAMLFRSMALWLAKDCDTRLDLAAAQGREALEAAWHMRNLRLPFMQFFATYGLLHLGCAAPACKRARRCASASFTCLRNQFLNEREEAEARASFSDFMQKMSAPETESERALRAGS